jgi:3-oxoacyl-[acyl-carrier protein] reductase
VAFARHGAKVVLHGRDTEALSKVQADITNGGGHAMFDTGDVAKFADIEAIRARVEEAYGLVDVLVACAGGSGSRPGPIEDISEESWRADLDANLTATFLTIKSFLPGMKRRGTGSIITMSSASAAGPVPTRSWRTGRRRQVSSCSPKTSRPRSVPTAFAPIASPPRRS